MKMFWAVGLFGIAGAVLRYWIGDWSHGWWPQSSFPAGTLVINLTGCVLLGWFSSWAASLSRLPAWLRVGFGTGFVGAYTTFSTFSVETVSLLQDDRAGLAALYILTSLIGGLICAGAGYALAQAQLRRRGGKGVQAS